MTRTESPMEWKIWYIVFSTHNTKESLELILFIKYYFSSVQYLYFNFGERAQTMARIILTLSSSFILPK